MVDFNQSEARIFGSEPMGGLDFAKNHDNLPNKGTPHRSVRTTGRGH